MYTDNTRAFALGDAIALAATLHEGQVDKAGQPFIFHAVSVMLDPGLITLEERIAGVLHDVIEDCGVSAEELLAMGCPPASVEAIVTVSKRPEEQDEENENSDGSKYRAFIRRIAETGGVISKKVKLADLRHNGKLSRTANPTDRDRRRTAKYAEAISLIEQSLLPVS